jgi:hypothetical protein
MKILTIGQEPLHDKVHAKQAENDQKMIDFIVIWVSGTIIIVVIDIIEPRIGLQQDNANFSN